METRSLTFSGGLILGASLMYLLDPERVRGKNTLGAESNAGVPRPASDSGPTSPFSAWPPSSWNARLQCIAGALGFAAVAYGAGLLAQGRRNDSTSTAYDIDTPNYAWLR